MLFTRSTGLALVGAQLVAGGGIALMGQEKTEKTMKKVPAPYSKPESGAQMFKDYCASCHGPAGAGDGPAAEILKSPPADLSLMAKQNNGKFPADHFASVLRFGTGGRAHGTADMPVWGPVFSSQGASEGVVNLRIRNLAEFVESLQQK